MSISCAVCGSHAVTWEGPCLNCERVEEIRKVIQNLPTRRDVFAAAALRGLLASTPREERKNLGWDAWLWADRMMVDEQKFGGAPDGKR